MTAAIDTAPTLDRRVIGGIEFEAVRELRPVPHWRARVVATGFTFEAGCFHNDSRPRLWADLEHCARLRGFPLWQSDNLTAHATPQGSFVLWGFHPSYANTDPTYPNGEPIKLTDYSRNAVCRYAREGWICAAYLPGEKPTALREMARGSLSACKALPPSYK